MIALTLISVNRETETALTIIRKGIRVAVAGIVHRISGLQQVDMARWLPTSVVGCISLPLALHILDIKLATFGQCIVERSQLSTLIRATQECYSRLDGAISALTMIQYFMGCTYYDKELHNHHVPSAAEPQFHKDSTDVLEIQPFLYLKLALTLDLSLIRGRLPWEGDYPASLRSFVCMASYFFPSPFMQTSCELSEVSTTNDTNTVSLSTSWAGMLHRWIENDRSLYFAREMGLGPFELDRQWEWGT